MPACARCRSDRRDLYQEPYGPRVLCERCMARECPGTLLEGQAAPPRLVTFHNFGTGEKRVEECERSAAQRVAEAPSRNGHGPDHAVPKPARQPPPPTVPKLTVLDTHRMLTTEPPPIDWLVEGIFARGKFTIVGGREKSGKSLIQLAFAAAMAAGGGNLADFTIKPGKVLLIDAENGERELHRRLRSLGLSSSRADNLVVAEARSFDLRDDLGLVEALVREHRPLLVLLDSFRSLWRGNERDEDEIAAALYPVADLAHRADIAVSLTHHATKRDGSDYRGSTAIGAAADWVAMLARDEGDPLKATRRMVTTPYTRFAAERPQRWLSITSPSDEGPITISAAEPYQHEHESPVQDELETALLTWVRRCGGPVGDRTTAPPTWTKAELARAVGRQPKDWAAREAIQRLVERGDLYANGDKWSPAARLFDPEETL